MQICVDPSTDPWRLPKGPWSCLLPLPPRLLLVGPSKARLWPSTPCGPSLTPELKECLNLVPVNGGLLGQKDSGEVTIWKLNGSVLLKKLQLTTPEFCIENHSVAISPDWCEVAVLSETSLMIRTQNDKEETEWQRVELPHKRVETKTVVWDERRKGWVVVLVVDQEEGGEVVIVLAYSLLRGLEEVGRQSLDLGEKGTLCHLADDGRLALVVTTTRIIVFSTATGKILASYKTPCTVVAARWILSSRWLILLAEMISILTIDIYPDLRGV